MFPEKFFIYNPEECKRIRITAEEIIKRMENLYISTGISNFIFAKQFALENFPPHSTVYKDAQFLGFMHLLNSNGYVEPRIEKFGLFYYDVTEALKLKSVLAFKKDPQKTETRKLLKK